MISLDAAPAKRRRARQSIAKGRPKLTRAERDFGRQLQGIAKHVGHLIGGFDVLEKPGLIPKLNSLLGAYATALQPWAKHAATRMQDEVNHREWDTWRALGLRISQGLKRDMQRTALGPIMETTLHDQVHLITSLPIEAGERVHRLTREALQDSTRAKDIAKQIGRSGEVTASRALLIARTEVSRTATILTQARSLEAGAETYVWQTSEDGAVRPGHRDMQGKTCEWASPPAVIENGKVMHFHAGCIWNCRCWCSPIITI